MHRPSFLPPAPPVRFYQLLQLAKHPPASPNPEWAPVRSAVTAQRSPSPRQQPGLIGAGSDTRPQHSTCSHTCQPGLDLASVQRPAYPLSLTSVRISFLACVSCAAAGHRVRDRWPRPWHSWGTRLPTDICLPEGRPPQPDDPTHRSRLDATLAQILQSPHSGS